MTAASPDRRAIITEALHKIDELSARLEIAEKADIEPIAVVGMGCRFPGGVDNPDEYWKLLQEGRSGIVRVPSERWDADAFYSEVERADPALHATKGWLVFSPPSNVHLEGPKEKAILDKMKIVVRTVERELRV